MVIDIEWGAFGDNGCLDFMKSSYEKEVDLHSHHAGSFTYVFLFYWPVILLHSLIGCCHHHVVCPSIRLSVLTSSFCLSVCPSSCVSWLSGTEYSAKSCTTVFLAGMFPFVRSDTSAVGCTHLATKHTGRKCKLKRVISETDNQACTGHVTLCYSLTL